MEMNNAKSIRAKLYNLSKQMQTEFQSIVTRYLHERFLYRLSVSAYAKQLCLKGGNLLYAQDGLASRPTLDVDLLGISLANDENIMKGIILEIINIPCDDCVWFDSQNLSSEIIAELKGYHGIRCTFNAGFDTIRQVLQIDIGFGDVLTPGPVQLTYPVLLSQLPQPLLNAYNNETVIAEKIHAMATLGSLNSRMKDIYDVYVLLSNGNTDPGILKEALQATFANRNTHTDSINVILTEEYASDKQRRAMWTVFLKKIKAPENLTFDLVMQKINREIKRMFKLK